VQGTYDDTDLSIVWDKTYAHIIKILSFDKKNSYIGAHTVYYKGKLVGKSIVGTWDIQVGYEGGTFELIYMGASQG